MTKLVIVYYSSSIIYTHHQFIVSVSQLRLVGVQLLNTAPQNGEHLFRIELNAFNKVYPE